MLRPSQRSPLSRSYPVRYQKFPPYHVLLLSYSLLFFALITQNPTRQRGNPTLNYLFADKNLCFIPRDIDPAVTSITNHLDNIDMGGLFCFIGGIERICSGLQLKDIQGVSPKYHISVSNFIDQLAMVITHIL